MFVCFLNSPGAKQRMTFFFFLGRLTWMIKFMQMSKTWKYHWLVCGWKGKKIYTFSVNKVYTYVNFWINLPFKCCSRLFYLQHLCMVFICICSTYMPKKLMKYLWMCLYPVRVFHLQHILFYPLSFLFFEHGCNISSTN